MRWVPIFNPDQKEINLLAESLSVDLLIAKILIQRGINSFDQAKSFFRPKLYDLYDPFLMRDMRIAVERIQKAILKNEKILIYGDYDVDGVTSVALVYSYLRLEYSNIIKYIPDRYKEGYGVSINGIDYAKKEGVNLIIALDCGITAIDQVSYAKELEIDFIICDHHIPLEKLPYAIAVLDPKRKDCDYPFKELCGCGIGFKLIQALNIINNKSFDDLLNYLDLVVIAIAADIVPIIGENRILAFYGLEQIRKQPRIGLKGFLNSIKSKVEINDLIYRIAPRINSSGRMDHAMNSVELLTEENHKNLDSISKKIENLNSERKVKQELTIKEALDQINNQNENFFLTTFVYNENWHKGVLGIVASKLIDFYYRPTIVLSRLDEFIVGSVRSVKGFDVYSVLKNCKSSLIQFGGHKYAAGITLSINKLDNFRTLFEENVKNIITEDQKIRSIYYESEIKFNEISKKFYRIVKQFAPFGPKNSIPVFRTDNCFDVGGTRLVGSDRSHLSMEIKDESGKIFKGIAFGMGEYLKKVKSNKKFSVLYSIEENTYNSYNSLQLKIRDIKFDL